MKDLKVKALGFRAFCTGLGGLCMGLGLEVWTPPNTYPPQTNIESYKAINPHFTRRSFLKRAFSGFHQDILDR